MIQIRNKTSAQILHAAAIVAAFAVPVIALIFAMREAGLHVRERLEFIADGTVVRADRMLGAVSDSLDSVDAALSSGDDLPGQVLRRVVFENRYLRSIGLWDDGEVWSSSEDHGATVSELDEISEGQQMPRNGEIAIVLGRRENGVPVSIIKILDSGQIACAELHPDILRDFFELHGPGRDLQLEVYFDDQRILNESVIELSGSADEGELDINSRKEWLTAEAFSSIFPLRVVTAASPMVVFERWRQSAPEYAAVGIVVGALMTAMALRVARRSQSLEADLRESIRFREIAVHYQPVIDIQTGRCIGCEALMRVEHPHRDVIVAGDFMDLAERTGLILPMSDQLFAKVVDEMAPMLAENRGMFVGINLSPLHFASKALVKSLKKTFDGRVSGDQILFEITERGLVGDKDTTARTIMEYLIARGGKLAVDDFGTGYSRLNCLQHFPLDYLKIDKAFVDGISSASASSGLVDQVIRIAESLGLDMIAEGVEHAYQVEYLKSRGVRLLQGWHFAKAMPADEFIAFANKRNA